MHPHGPRRYVRRFRDSLTTTSANDWFLSVTAQIDAICLSRNGISYFPFFAPDEIAPDEISETIFHISHGEI